MSILKCIFCQEELKNGSFSSSNTYVYLTCGKCNKRNIILKMDYEEDLLNKLKDYLVHKGGINEQRRNIR
jgi:hypothetical protein